MKQLNELTLYFPKYCSLCKQRLGKLRCNVGEIECIQCEKNFCETCYKDHEPLSVKCRICNMTGVFGCVGDFYNKNTCSYCVY